MRKYIYITMGLISFFLITTLVLMVNTFEVKKKDIENKPKEIAFLNVINESYDIKN